MEENPEGRSVGGRSTSAGRGRARGIASLAIAAGLALAVSVPTVIALAEPNGGSSAEASQADVNPWQKKGDSADAPSPVSESDDAGADGTAAAEGTNVTIIVQLEDEGTQGISLMSTLAGTEDQDRHSFYKEQIRNLVDAMPAAYSENGEQADAPIFEEIHDYYHVIDGFAVKAPASTLEQIRQMDGVKRAFVENSYAVPVDQGDQGDYKNQSSLDMTGADTVSEKGDGQVIAIIDSGVQVSHEAFTGDLDDEKVKQTASDIDAVKSQLGAGKNGAYYSEKIPFQYDYANNDADATPNDDPSLGLEHGTHVAGIAAANGGDQIRGAAPNAQIVAMKVADDTTGSLYDSAIMAALDDAAVLDVDTINMSLGSDGGFGSEDSHQAYSDAFKKLEEQGVTINVAAGNAYSAALGNKSEANLPYATDPDAGIVSTPSSVAEALSVASVNNARPRPAFLAADGTAIAYNLMGIQTNGATTGTSPDLTTLAEGDYEYLDAGYGSSAEVNPIAEANNWDLTGKILLIQRGGTDADTGENLTFTQKVQNAVGAGASGVIVYNNEDGALDNAAVADMVLNIPVVCISKADGEALKAAETKKITVKADLSVEASKNYEMSNFSSLGTTPDLKLKPEVTAPGGNIYSSVLNGGYDWMSGTSMATPQLAGITAQLHEYVDSDAKFEGMSEQEKGAAVTQLLMSTATPIADPDVEGSYYTPRKQGAGLVNVPAATTTTVYATVDGAEEASRPKAELGSSAEGTWSFTVTLHNLGDAEQVFTPDTAALSEQVADGLFQQASDNWTGKGIDVSYAGDAYDASANTVTVPAKGTASYTVTVTAGQAFKDFASANTPNGTFVDGFAFLKATSEGGVDLSVPFLAFYGDWGAAPAFDSTALEGDYHAYGSVEASPAGTPLGVNPLDSDALALVQAGDYSQVDTSKMVVSNMAYDSAPSQLIPLTGLLRGVDNLTYTYRDSDGNAVRTYSYDYATKSYYYQTGGYMLSADDRLGYSPFDGKAENGSMLPDGTYTLERTATTSGPDAKTVSGGTTTFQFDTQGPRVDSIKTTGTGDDAKIEVSVTDSSWLAAFDFDDPDGGYFYRVLAKDLPEPVTNDDGTRTWTFSVPVSAVKEAWQKSEEAIGTNDPIPNTVPVYAWDYGMNPSSRGTAVVTPVAATGITLDAAEVTLAPGQHHQVTATVQPEDSTETDLTWTSSDEGVVTVDEQGNLTGVSNGTASVRAASTLNPDVYAEATITVAAVPAETGIVMSTPTLSVEPGATAEVTALLADELKGQEVTWESSDPEVLSVTASADDSTHATVTGGEKVGDVTLTAKVADKSATMSVSVRPADYDDFIIDEATGTLTAYAGNRSDVTIPSNVTAIGEKAFMSTPVARVTVPKGVTTIGAEAFENTPNLETVTFEGAEDGTSQLTTIGDKAFYYTLKLTKIELPDSVTSLGAGVFSSSKINTVDLGTGITQIPDDTFNGSAQLASVTMSDAVTSFGSNAFFGNSYVTAETIHLTGAAEGATGLPSKLERIGDGALYGTGLTGDLVLPAGVTYLGGVALGSTALTSVTLPEGLTYIGGSAFTETNISELVVPDTVSELGSDGNGFGAFAGMTKLTKVTLGSALPADALVRGFVGDVLLDQIDVSADNASYTAVDGVLFNKDKTQLVAYPLGRDAAYAVPDGVTEIADYAFNQGKAASVTFPESLKTVGESAFEGSALAGDVTLPDGLERIGASAFMNLQITGVNIGGATEIAGSAFYSDPQLVSVDLRPDLNRLTVIGPNAFALSPAITAIVMPDSLTTLGDGALANIEALQKVHIGAGLTGDISGFVTGSNNLTELTVSENNPVYSAEDNVLYGQMSYDAETDADGNPTFSGQHLILSLPTNTFTEYTVKPGTVQIDDQAFRNNTALTKVVLPEGLRALGTGAFNNCTALTDINFPDSLEYVSGLYSVPLSVADFGPNVVKFNDAFMGNMPDHLVVRGMSDKGDGSFEDSMDFTDNSGSETMYFGSGVRSVTLSYTPARGIMVVPATLEKLALDSYANTEELTKAFQLYAPKDSAAWQVASDALTAIGADPATQLHDYQPLAVNVAASGEATPGASVTLAATATGGVDGAKEFRVVQKAADGTEEVLADWAAGTEAADGTTTFSYEWAVPAEGAVEPTVEVRDATMLTAEAAPAAAPVITVNADLDPTPLTVAQGSESPVLSVDVASEGAELAYQWYLDGEAVEGATGASYSVPTGEAGEHAYYVVVTATKDGLSSTFKSASKSVKVTAAAAEVDKSALTQAISDAQAALAAGTDKTDEAKAALQAAIDAAQTVVDNASATQGDVDAATAELHQAVTDFEASAPKPGEKPGEGGNGGTDGQQQPGGGSGSDGQQTPGAGDNGSGSATKPGAASPSGGTAKVPDTGDQSLPAAALAGTGVFGAFLAAAGAILRRRSRHDGER